MMDRIELFKRKAIEKYEEYFGLWTASVIYLVFISYRIKLISAVLLTTSCLFGLVIYLSPVVSHIHDDKAKYIFIGTICAVCTFPLLGFEVIGGIVVLSLSGLAYGIASVDISQSSPHSPFEQLLNQHKLISFRQIYPDRSSHDISTRPHSGSEEHSHAMTGKLDVLGLRNPQSYDSDSVPVTNRSISPPPLRSALVNPSREPGASSPRGLLTARFLSNPDDQEIAFKSDLSISKYLVESVPTPSMSSDYSSDKTSARICIPPAEAAKLIEKITALRLAHMTSLSLSDG
jgi:hypothetical protein